MPARSSDFDYDNGYNNFDVRHTFNLSALYTFPAAVRWLGGWSVGGIVNARSGLPVPVLIQRNDIVYVDGAGNVFNNPAADRDGGRSTRRAAARRATRAGRTWCRAWIRSSRSGGLLFLNPAAFATPKPGTFGNLERNSIHGPGFRQVDLVVAKRIGVSSGPNVELRPRSSTSSTSRTSRMPVGTLPNALPSAALTRSQPGAARAAVHGGRGGHVRPADEHGGRTVGLGTPRQVQFALRFNF